MLPSKASADDFLGRFREIVSDPINLLIERVPMAGVVQGNVVILHNGNQVPLSGDGSYYGDFSHILVINRGVHEPLEEYVFQEMLKQLDDRPLMLELGAYGPTTRCGSRESDRLQSRSWSNQTPMPWRPGKAISSATA
jgi:hypothetical protein